MLFCYPPEAASENWLHDGLTTLLTRALAGEPNPLEDWLMVFPEAKRDEVARKPTFIASLRRVVEQAALLTDPERAAYLSCMQAQNRIPQVFDPAEDLPDWPEQNEAFVKLVGELFEIAFKMLTPTGVRDRQYEFIYDRLPAHVCAFCGIEPLSAPDPIIPRESLDHYLSAARYPFAAVNLRNLAPAGTKCNSSHKLSADMLRDQNNARRRCFDPFGQAVATVSLRNSRPLEGPIKKMFVLPDWQIELLGDPDAVATWDTVYDIRTRYRLNVLDAELRNWLDHFALWCAREASPPTTRDELIALIGRYQQGVIQEGFADFLKRETFRMLSYQCQHGDSADRVAAWLISLLSPGTGAAAFSEGNPIAA